MIRKYPIGIQSFRKIRQKDYVYIDKTEIIHTLVSTGDYYFLSRPRRFGKSLLIDTIEELFNGSKDLFKGLWIYDKWDWSKTHPVIHFSFASIGVTTSGFEAAIHGALEDNAIRLGITLIKKDYDLRFKELIQKASAKGQVVILIDEYDKPIIDFLEAPDQIESHRSMMKTFYSILKDCDQYIRFLMITGVSQFSKVSIFSDLNNLENITMSPHYGTLVGITQQELEKTFGEEISKMQINSPDILTRIKEWYNGYTWNMQIKVYNPFSLLNFMKNGIFANYWFETATPTFLYKLLQKKAIYDVGSFETNRTSLSSFNTENPDISALLFQTGYLTIKESTPDFQRFKLGFPNLEVKNSLLDGLLSIYLSKDGTTSIKDLDNIKQSLLNGNIPDLIGQLNTTFTSIPDDLGGQVRKHSFMP